MLTEEAYFKLKGTYPFEFNAQIYANGVETLKRANRLLEIFRDATGADLAEYGINSGWRPPSYNKAIANAARKSKHMTGEAIDINDDDGDLDQWCMDNLNILEGIGLWLEHPSATKGWCHLQIVPPRSGRRVFYP